jgi:hypothetical protein
MAIPPIPPLMIHAMTMSPEEDGISGMWVGKDCAPIISPPWLRTRSRLTVVQIRLNLPAK